MELISKDRFDTLWKVLVEDSSSTNVDQSCAMGITNGVSKQLGDFLVESANGDDTCLAAKYQIPE